MLKGVPFFASYAVDDMAKAKTFYGEALGLDVEEQGEFLLWLRGPNGSGVLIYAREGHQPPENTVLNFQVDDIEAAVEDLTAAGITFEQYDEGPLKTNEKGIATPGPKQAWFKDPTGNILSLIQE
jgi:predicted enzyme related to lactoylglutathione lyase